MDKIDVETRKEQIKRYAKSGNMAAVFKAERIERKTHIDFIRFIAASEKLPNEIRETAESILNLWRL